MGTISRDFSYHEFEASDMADSNGIVNRIVSDEVRNSVKALVENVLQPLRDAWGKPLHISSGYRCQELNKAVGGVPSSQHVLGEAADISCRQPWRLAEMAIALKLPFDQMILYPSFVHFSHSLRGRQRKMVLYSKDYNGRKP
ncbi:MAG: D-Ala-D-Ala carboxypeptidase family metallohydrolase [Bacteroidales bacterium]|nr:D-Ala-D-Ala carboxypeptidase family metallohydrolase [Bacteroides sp.]MCM1198494.1 D-Ala-D-Ala carboxypeptidase family metallohydrolase [Clostridium sp.]MCM1502175.1 D-Ala-D-Ala carboxypeptidase family metallohydrolase [Bacteroidales bacterium]